MVVISQSLEYREGNVKKFSNGRYTTFFTVVSHVQEKIFGVLNMCCLSFIGLYVAKVLWS